MNVEVESGGIGNNACGNCHGHGQIASGVIAPYITQNNRATGGYSRIHSDWTVYSGCAFMNMREDNDRIRRKPGKLNIEASRCCRDVIGSIPCDIKRNNGSSGYPSLSASDWWNFISR